MALPDNCLKSLCGLGLAVGAFGLGAIGVPVATGLLEALTKGGELAIDLKGGPRNTLDDIEKRIRKSIEKNYITWLDNSKSEGRSEADILAALENLPEAMRQANITIDDMKLSNDKFAKAIVARLPKNSIYRETESIRGVFIRMITSVRNVAVLDEKLRPYFELSRWESIVDAFDEAQKDRDEKHDEAQADRDAKHQEMMAAIAKDKGVPVENLRSLFEAVEMEIPNATETNFEQHVKAAVDALKARAASVPDVFNDGEEINAAIRAAREKLASADIDGAIESLRAARLELGELRKAKARGEARLAKEEAEILKIAFRWDEAIEAYETAAEHDPDYAGYWIEIGDIRRHRGNLDLAMAAYEGAQKVANKSEDDDYLAICHSRIGNILFYKGRLVAALVSFEACLGIRQRLIDSDPTNTGWHRNLSVSHEKIGDVQVSKGDFDGALVSFEDSLEIRQRLSEIDRGNSEWQRDLSVSHNKIGGVQVLKDEIDGVLVSFMASLEIQQNLSKSDPSNAQWRRDLIVSHVYLAELGQDTVGNFEQALKIASELEESGRLIPTDTRMLTELKKLLSEARSGT